MTISKGRLTASLCGRLESKPVQRELTHPLCTLQHRALDDLEQTMCDALVEEEKRVQSRNDAHTFELQKQFMRVHGMPRGEVTILCTGGLLQSGAGTQ